MNDCSHQRLCPACGNSLSYSNKSTLKRAEKRNTRCGSCALVGNTRCNNRVPWNIGLNSDSDVRVKKYSADISASLTGKKQSKETIQKRISKTFGRKNTAVAIDRMERAAVKRVQEYGSKSRGYSKIACAFIDNVMNKSFGFNFQHALNGGEIVISNKFVDGYDKDKNVVFEYDEKAHHKLSYKIRDEKKQSRIVKDIDPLMFIRYDEKNNRLYDALTNTDFAQI